MQTSIVSYKISRNNQGCGTVTLISNHMGYSAGIATQGGFRHTSAQGETPVDALYKLMDKPLGLEYGHEIKHQVISRQMAN